MKVLVIGDGAAEHAIVWKLSQSRHINKIYCCPGNTGTAEIAESIDVSPYKFRTLIDFVKYEWIDLTIVCSRKLFLKGIVNAFEKDGCKILGLHKSTAQFMTSRVSIKNLLRQYRIPTPEYRVFTSFLHAQDYIRIKGAPLTIRTDGSLDNNGIFTASSIEDATEALKMTLKDRPNDDAGNRVIVEESLHGDKISFVTVTDGKTIIPLTDLYKYGYPGKDNKGHIENEMVIGAYSPTGIVTEALKNAIMIQIMEPLRKAFQSEGIQYKGILIADLICTLKKPYIVELKCCFPDPETQTILPLLKKDLFEIFFSAIEERLSDVKIELIQKTSACIIVPSSGYPRKKLIIKELDKIKSLKDVTVFHGDVPSGDVKTVSEGKSAFSITATGNDLKEAQQKAYKAIDEIHPEVMHYIKDICKKNLN